MDLDQMAMELAELRDAVGRLTDRVAEVEDAVSTSGARVRRVGRLCEELSNDVSDLERWRNLSLLKEGPLR